MDADDAPTPDPDEHIILTTPAEAFAELADLEPPEFEGDGEPGTEAETGDFDAVSEVAPAVVAVVVVHNAGDWLDETLESLGGQTYRNLSVLVIDAASDIDPTPRVARVLPGAFVRRLEHNVGFGPTMNEVLDLVSGASFFCLCHDDVALEPNAIHRMVEEAFRSNAGVVGPKLVDWDDPELLSNVGFTVDPSGGRAPYAEPGELDQGQHDAVRDVFAVAGGCTLVRADLFAHLGGFDPAIDLLGEDLDLCWRAHLVGARVVVAPQASARHRSALAERIDESRLNRVDAVHRIRTVLTNYRLSHLVVLVPQLLVVSAIEAIVEATIGRPGHARALIGAWTTNLRRAPSIVAERRRVRPMRERSDRSIRRLQTHTLARLGGLIQAHRRAKVIDAAAGPGDFEAESDTEGFVREQTPRRQRSLVFWGVLAVAVVAILGTRELFFGSLPAIGSFAGPPRSLGDVWRTWLGSWNPIGLGSSSSPAAGLGPMSLVGSIFGGAFGFLRRVCILLPIPIGMFGAWRLAAPLASRRAQLVALVVYAAVPVPWNALAQGRWGGLLVYAGTPWLIGCLVAAMQDAPFGNDSSSAAPRWWSRVLGFGLLVGVIGSLVPAIAGVVVVVAVALAVSSVLTGRFRGLARLGIVTVGGVVVAAVLLLPWTVAGPARSLWSLAGMRAGTHGWLSLSDLLRFQSGPMGAGWLGYAFLVVAALPLVIGRSWRFAWGVRAWGVACAGWTVVWLGQQDWFDLPIPPPEVFLAVAAAGLALAAACGMVAFERDLRGFGFGWAQAASVLAGVALVLGALPTIGNATDGRWKMAPIGLDQALSSVVGQRSHAAFRVMWIGDPDVVPVAGRHLDDGLSIGVSNRGMPNMTELWASGDPGGTRALVEALDLATTSQTTRLGRVLADMGVRYIVLPRQIVPLPYRTTAHELPPRLVSGLDDQLDLDRVSANDAVIVYRNNAWKPGLTLHTVAAMRGRSTADALDASSGTSVPGTVDPTRGATVQVPNGGVLATHQAADPSWRLTVDGRPAKPVTLWGWEQGFIVPHAGTARLSHRSDPTRGIILALIALAWCASVVGWLIGRRRRADADVLEPAGPLSTGEGSLIRLGTETSRTAAVAVDQVEVADLPAPDDTTDDDSGADGTTPSDEADPTDGGAAT